MQNPPYQFCFISTMRLQAVNEPPRRKKSLFFSSVFLAPPFNKCVLENGGGGNCRVLVTLIG